MPSCYCSSRLRTKKTAVYIPIPRFVNAWLLMLQDVETDLRIAETCRPRSDLVRSAFVCPEFRWFSRGCCLKLSPKLEPIETWWAFTRVIALKRGQGLHNHTCSANISFLVFNSTHRVCSTLICLFVAFFTSKVGRFPIFPNKSKFLCFSARKSPTVGSNLRRGNKLS